jgi:hypothetical protein
MRPRSASIATDKLHQNRRKLHTGFAATFLAIAFASIGCDDASDGFDVDPETLGTAIEPEHVGGSAEVDLDLGLEFRDVGDRPIIMIDCNDTPCVGLWQWSVAWSPVYPKSVIAALPNVNPGSLWPCEPNPAADACKRIDSQGHVGCWRWVYNDLWAVAVAPLCQTQTWPDWISVGNAMEAKVTKYYNPY